MQTNQTSISPVVLNIIIYLSIIILVKINFIIETIDKLQLEMNRRIDNCILLIQQKIKTVIQFLY